VNARHAGAARGLEHPLQQPLADAEAPMGGPHREQHEMRALVAKLHDCETGEGAARRAALAALAGHHGKRFAVADGAQHARRVVFPSQPCLDEVARHHPIAWASRGSASRMVIARGGVIAAIVPLSRAPGVGALRYARLQAQLREKGRVRMERVDRPTVQSSAADLADAVKSRSASDAAAKLAGFSGTEIAAVLMHLSPGFAQDVLGALPDEARERVLAAAPPEVSRQWQRNALYEPDAIGRMMEPVLAAFSHQHTVGETIERLREMVKSALITYVYVVDPADYLLGIVTMRDLLFSDHDRLLSEVMFRDVFALHAAMPLKDAMKLVLDRHYPVYPVVDAERRLLGLVRGHSMFEAQAIEITLQAGSMVGWRGKSGSPRRGSPA